MLVYFFMFNLLNNYNKEAKFDCSTGKNHICCPVAANEINKCSTIKANEKRL